MQAMFKLKRIGMIRPGGRRRPGFPPHGFPPHGFPPHRFPHPDFPHEEPAAAQGLSFPEVAFLRSISAEGRKGGEPQGMAEMREHLSVSKARLSQLVAGLERRGLVTRETDPDNRRKIIVRTTPAGEEMVAAIKKEIDTQIDAVIVRFGEDDMRELIRLVEKLADTISELREGEA